MNLKNTLYIVSLILIITAVFLLVGYPNSERMALISGMLLPIGLGCNIAGFLLKNQTDERVSNA